MYADVRGPGRRFEVRSSKYAFQDRRAASSWPTRLWASTSQPLQSRWISNVEPLRAECEHFVRCVREGTAPISDGAAGLRVVRVLEALQRSLDETRRAGVARTVAVG